MDVITIRAFTRVMFTYVRYSYKIEGACENRVPPPLTACRQWWRGHRYPCLTIEPGARNGLWNTEPFISGEDSSRRAIPSRLAKLFDPVLSVDKLGIHLEVKLFEPTKHQHRENWKIFDRGTYILTAESQMYSGPSRSRNSLPKSHDLGIGVCKVQKRQVQFEFFTYERNSLLKFLCLM